MRDEYLRDRLDHLGAGPDTADWNDALRRANDLRRRRRRRTLTLALLTIAVVVTTPAFAAAFGEIDFWSRESAPQVAKLQFAELNTGAPEGMTPRVDASEARSVLTRTLHSGKHTLWVAPTVAGGFCYTLSDVGGTCAPPPPRNAIGVFLSRADEESPFVLSGAVFELTASEVEIVLDNGSSVATPLTVVGAPIDAGFFVIQLPNGSRASALVARSADGAQVARRALPPQAGVPRR